MFLDYVNDDDCCCGLVDEICVFGVCDLDEYFVLRIYDSGTSWVEEVVMDAVVFVVVAAAEDHLR